MEKNLLESVAHEIVQSGLEVHKELGPGLLESVYVCCLVSELKFRRLKVEQEKALPLYFKGVMLNKEFRIDLLVEDEIIIEVKAVETLLPVHIAQIISYLKLADKRLGFLFNFHTPVFKYGLRRFVNKY